MTSIVRSVSIRHSAISPQQRLRRHGDGNTKNEAPHYKCEKLCPVCRDHYRSFLNPEWVNGFLSCFRLTPMSKSVWNLGPPVSAEQSTVASGSEDQDYPCKTGAMTGENCSQIVPILWTNGDSFIQLEPKSNGGRGPKNLASSNFMHLGPTPANWFRSD